VAYLFALIAIAAGLILMVGGIRKSPWITPTERNLFHHPLTFIGLFVPERWLWVSAIVAGVAWIGLGVFVIWRVSGDPICALQSVIRHEGSRHLER
jgi:hypothetical protein